MCQSSIPRVPNVQDQATELGLISQATIAQTRFNRPDKTALYPSNFANRPNIQAHPRKWILLNPDLTDYKASLFIIH
jgi:hypothetical protein